MLLLALVAISLIKTSQCVKAIPGQPVPHAEVLDNLLSDFLGDSYSNSALFDFILGQPSENRDNLTGDNLDISILDVNTVRKIINFAKKKYADHIMMAEKTRRDAYVAYPGNEVYEWHPYIVNKTLDLMAHTMYMTKEKINQTRPFRQRYASDFGYQIAILYGSAAVILLKMENLYNEFTYYFFRTHFLWHLLMYEKLLTCNIDVNDAVEKIFIIQGEYEQVRGPKDEVFSMKAAGNLSQQQVKNMMLNPQQAGGMAKHLKRFQRK